MKKILSWTVALTLVLGMSICNVFEPNGRAAAENVTVGSTYVFGSYEQDNDLSNGKEPIEWIVLDVNDDGSLLLISLYGLDARVYNEGYDSVTWETCALRAWLNENFYNEAFTLDEQEKIATVHNVNEDNPSSGADGGNDTDDNVWLLSISEAKKYFGGDYSKAIITVTEYAVAQAIAQGGKLSIETINNMLQFWWLRSPGLDSEMVALVVDDGSIDKFGTYTSAPIAIRPIICVKP